jgi:hypothetical protein
MPKKGNNERGMEKSKRREGRETETERRAT